MSEMIITSILKKLIPTRVKQAFHFRVANIARQVYVKEWAEQTLTPFHQRMERLETDIYKVRDEQLNSWIESSIIPLDQNIKRLEAEVMKLQKELSVTRANYLSIKKQHSHIVQQNSTNVLATDLIAKELTTGQLLKDDEYLEFESRHHQKFANHSEDYKKNMISLLRGKQNLLDIGCGTGGFLTFVRDNLPSTASVQGVDINPIMVEIATEQGLQCKCLDAVTALKSEPVAKYDAITCFHIVEHLSDDYLRAMLEEAYNALSKGGTLLIETPNIQSLYVLSHYYYQDPTHLSPRHPTLLSYLLEAIGFAKVELKFVSAPPIEEIFWNDADTKYNNKLISKLNDLLFSSGSNVLLVAEK